MTAPAYLLGLVLALLVGSLFHVWRDGGAGRLLYFIVLSVAGAGAGQWFGSWRNWMVLPVGPLNAGLVTFGSLLFLGVGYWLSLVEIRGTGRKNDEV
jgi:hypothetical protein